MGGSVGGMVKTTLYLPDDLKGRLKRKAIRTRRSEADLIREALAESLADEAPRLRPSWGGGHSGDPTITERMDEILAAEFGADGIDR